MILLLLLMLQETREVRFSDAPIVLRVPVSTPEEHRATVVTFPETSLEALVAGWKEEDLSVERRDENLFIKLLRATRGDLHVLGRSGTLYRLSVRPAEGAYDGRVRIRLLREKGWRVPEPIELIRAMRRGRRPGGMAVLRADQKLPLGPGLDARTRWVYDAGAYRGYVVAVTNVSPESKRLDASRFMAEQLVLVGAREWVLEPGAQTALYLVFGTQP